MIIIIMIYQPILIAELEGNSLAHIEAYGRRHRPTFKTSDRFAS